MKVLFFANTDWYLYNFRRSLAIALKDAGHEVVLISPSGPYGPRLRDLGFRWIEAPMNRRSLNPLKEGLLLAWLARVFRQEAPDLVHGFTIKCAVYACMAGRLMSLAGQKIGRVAAVAGMGYVFTSSDARASILRPLVRTAIHLALGGPQMRLILQNPDDVALFKTFELVDDSVVRLIPGSGVDCERFHPPAHIAHEDGIRTFRVLLPARPLWDKGLQEFADAARLVRQIAPRVEFVLAGACDPGNPSAVPQATVEAWVGEGVMTWLGHVEDMPQLLRSVDAVVLPSYREGLPKGLIEAAASGLPLVASDVPGCRDVITHDEDGLLVPARDSRQLADAILRLLQDPELRVRLGSAARAKALSLFSERLVISRTLDVYGELLTPKRDA